MVFQASTLIILLIVTGLNLVLSMLMFSWVRSISDLTDDRFKIVEKRFDDVIQAIAINTRKDHPVSYPKPNVKIKPVFKTDKQLYEMELEKESK